MRKIFAILSVLIILSIFTGCEASCEHTWDSGVAVEGGTDAYLMEYTCTACGKKDQQIITIIPEEDTTEAKNGLYSNAKGDLFCIVYDDTITVSRKNDANAVTASSIESQVFKFILENGYYKGENEGNTISFKLNGDLLNLKLDGKAYYLSLDENVSFNDEIVVISKPSNVNIDASQVFWYWRTEENNKPYENGILSACLKITSKENELIKEEHINYIPEPAAMFSYDLKNMKLAPGEYILLVKYTGGFHVKNGAVYQSVDSDALIFSVTVTEDNNYITSINPPPPLSSNLEFQIGANVDDIDFSLYQEKYGMFGGHEYYGTGYTPTFDEHNQPIDPEHCVIYTVTSYPDYSDKEQHITGIYITDPTVMVYGISLNASFEDFERLITEEGFVITDLNENQRTAKKEKFSITFTKEWIRIRAEVENKDGIIF